LLTVLRRESPLILAKETIWRTQKRWRQMQLQERLGRTGCPVVFRPAGYYRAQPGAVNERARGAILRCADSVCRGQFPWLAHGPVQLGFPPRWNFDFVSGNTWPEAAADTIQVVRHDGSDVKVPWELSRLQFLPVLGKAWRLSNEPRYQQAARDVLIDWIRKNPVRAGVNWTIAMEAALRAISICLFLELAGPLSGKKDSIVGDVTLSLWQHLLFIEAHNEFSHLARSNHYLSNIVGLFCLSSFLHGPGMEKRRRHYRNLVEQEIVKQVFEDGGDFEASTGYHVLVLQMFTTAWLLMRAQDTGPSPRLSSRLQRMYGFLAALADPRGRVPHLGDCDDGRIELLSDDLEQMLSTTFGNRHSLTVSGLLGIGGALFGQSFGSQLNDAAWYGPISDSREGRPANPAGGGCVVFPNSGLAVARNGQAEVVFLAMPNGVEGKGSHTHNDKLSVIVRLGGEELFHDSGTGCYTRDTEMRNRFRSTAAHNTVQIDGQEQNRFSRSPRSAFLIGDDAHVAPITREETDGVVMLRSSHDGYSRLGVTHSRIVKLTPHSLIELEDHFTGSGRHKFEGRFHLDCKWRVEIEQEAGMDVSCCIRGPRIAAKLSCQAPAELHISCVPGKMSTAYGVVDDALTILVRGAFQMPVQLFSRISWKA